MKKSFVIILICTLFVFFSSGILAITTDMRNSYEPRETAIVKIYGNVLNPIDYKQVTFLRGHVEVPFVYDLKNLNGSYFLWATMPQTKNNYTLRINDISSTVSGETQKVDFEQNFSVEGNMSSYNIEPGFITAKGGFNINANLFEDFDRIISVDYPIRKDVTIKPGKNVIEFPFDDSGGTELIEIRIGKYSLPVYIISNKSSSIIKGPIIIAPNKIEKIHLFSEKGIIYSFEMYNSLDRELKDVQISYNKDVFTVIPSTKTFDISSGERLSFNLSLKKNIREGIYDQILIQSEKENISVAIPVYINFTENVSELIASRNITIRNISNGSDGNIKEGFYCSELGGKLCLSDEKCGGEEVESLDGKCCVGSCTAEKGGSKLIGYLIAIIALMILIYIYYKYKKAKPGATILEKKMTISNKKVP
mgnify:CR=1 FL=1